MNQPNLFDRAQDTAASTNSYPHTEATQEESVAGPSHAVDLNIITSIMQMKASEFKKAWGPLASVTWTDEEEVTREQLKTFQAQNQGTNRIDSAVGSFLDQEATRAAEPFQASQDNVNFNLDTMARIANLDMNEFLEAWGPPVSVTWTDEEGVTRKQLKTFQAQNQGTDRIGSAANFFLEKRKLDKKRYLLSNDEIEDMAKRAKIEAITCFLKKQDVCVKDCKMKYAEPMGVSHKEEKSYFKK